VALLDMSLGIAGAVPAGWFLLPISNTADPDRIHIAGLVGALLGAFVLVALSEVVAREHLARTSIPRHEVSPLIGHARLEPLSR